MCNRTSVLVHDKHDRQSRVQEFSFALGSRLLYGVKYFLKRNDRDDGSHDVLIVPAAEYRLSDRERHLLSGANDLRPANNQTTTIHLREHFANTSVDFFQADHVGLEGAVQRSINGPERERDQVWIFLQGFLEPVVVTGVV